MGDAVSFAAMAVPPPSLSPAELARYSRHLLLGEIGLEGQRQLAAGRVLVVGAGGLGSPAALYLAAAGVGTIGIADFDRVEPHNLQRQLLHTDASVGEPKVSSAARRLRGTNPFIRVVEHAEGITPTNALAVFSDYDVIIDGTDRFSSRYLNNDAAFFTRRPLVYGSVYKFEGQVAVFDSAHGGPCYRCLFPVPPESGSVPGCGEAGVLGALCGVIGSLQALEAIKLLTGIGESLRGRLLTYDALHQRFQSLVLPRNRHCPLCGEQRTINVVRAEGESSNPAPPEDLHVSPTGEFPLEISVGEAKRLVDRHPEKAVVIDVREAYELEICRLAEARHIPMREVPGETAALPRDKHLLILCHSGVRSLRVTKFLRDHGFNAVSNITGGIDAWAVEIEPDMPRY